MKIMFSILLLAALVVPQTLRASPFHVSKEDLSPCATEAFRAAQAEVQNVNVPIINSSIDVIRENEEYFVSFGSHYIAFDYTVLTKLTDDGCDAEVVSF